MARPAGALGRRGRARVGRVLTAVAVGATGVAGGVLATGAAVVPAVVTTACLPNLTANLCGDGIIESPETCDPGPNGSPGCTSTCQPVCGAIVDGGSSRYDESLSNHCYFSARRTETNANAYHVCAEQGAHLVTFVDDHEFELVHGLGARWPNDARYWVGLNDERVGSAYFASSNLEPGWRPTSCPGCYLPGATDASLTAVDGGPEAGPSEFVVATDLDEVDDGTMAVTGANGHAEVVCEREPPGSRSASCFKGDFCFSVLATLQPITKTYVFSPIAMTAPAAAAACLSLSDAGTPSLVVFESRAEREQVIYELTQLSAQGFDFQGQFWIGLSASAPLPDAAQNDAGGDAGTPWEWADGKHALPFSTSSRPAVWGDHQPNATLPAHAYINTLSGSYDTGLAYAASDGPNPPEFPFVCQL